MTLLMQSEVPKDIKDVCKKGTLIFGIHIALSDWEKKLISASLIAGFSLSELAVSQETKEKLDKIAELTAEIPEAWKVEYGKQLKENLNE